MQPDKAQHDREWLQLVLANTEALLKDHAHCERKAAGTALSLISRYPEKTELVAAMAELAQEELGHFAEVHQKITDRGWELGPDLGDPYAKALVDEVEGTRIERYIDRLLVSALIEARSCERLQLLAEHHPDADLKEMFGRFASAEATHGRVFYDLARLEDADRTRKRFAEMKELEKKILLETPLRPAMH
tara:strand:- start:847 stop:1416 length:570 start_codon:yes stop_codon:yes gene_type:complete